MGGVRTPISQRYRRGTSEDVRFKRRSRVVPRGSRGIRLQSDFLRGGKQVSAPRSSDRVKSRLCKKRSQRNNGGGGREIRQMMGKRRFVAIGAKEIPKNKKKVSCVSSLKTESEL